VKTTDHKFNRYAVFSTPLLHSWTALLIVRSSCCRVGWETPNRLTDETRGIGFSHVWS